MTTKKYDCVYFIVVGPNVGLKFAFEKTPKSVIILDHKPVVVKYVFRNQLILSP